MSRRIGLRYVQITGGKKFKTLLQRFSNRGFETGVKAPWTNSGEAGNDVTQVQVHTGAWAYNINGLLAWVQQLFVSPYARKEDIETFEFWHQGSGGTLYIIYNGGLISSTSGYTYDADWTKWNVLSLGAFTGLPAGATIEGMRLISNATFNYVDDFSCVG